LQRTGDFHVLEEMMVFKTHFKDFSEQYAIIGGMACDLLFSDAGLDFRATKDIDMVLIVEALTVEFAGAFWRFIDDGGYRSAANRSGDPEFYRFEKPANAAYPKMIELFSRPGSGVRLQYSGHLTPLHVDDGVLSLSAILLNDDYYRFLLKGRTIVEDIVVLDALHLIVLKMKAWLDLTDQKAAGSHVNDRDLRKHRLDVFRLYQLLSQDTKLAVPAAVFGDIRRFIGRMRAMIAAQAPSAAASEQNAMLDMYESIYPSE
jgi:hypothetical protein